MLAIICKPVKQSKVQTFSLTSHLIRSHAYIGAGRVGTHLSRVFYRFRTLAFLKPEWRVFLSDQQYSFCRCCLHDRWLKHPSKFYSNQSQTFNLFGHEQHYYVRNDVAYSFLIKSSKIGNAHEPSVRMDIICVLMLPSPIWNSPWARQSPQLLGGLECLHWRILEVGDDDRKRRNNAPTLWS